MTTPCPHCDDTTPHRIEKYCPQCKETKPHTAFYRNKALRGGGLTPYCKLCTKASQQSPEALARRRQRRAESPTNHRIGRPSSLPRDEQGNLLLTEKYCPQCQQTKPVSAFHRNASQPDGLHGWCKDCRNGIHQRPEEQTKRQRLHRTWYESNQEHSRTSAQQWRIDNPDRVRENDHNRRARKSNAPINDLTEAQWRAILKLYRYRCVYCGTKLPAKKLTQDHITPLVHGGSHTAQNIVPACRSCNSRKRSGKVLVPVQPVLLI